jgi:MFS transporter, PAT family, beta-lactamase induction signal transducer AmpG
MTDDQVGALNLWSSIISGIAMVIGGLLSDRLGRRRTLFVYLATMSLPVLYLMIVLQQHGYVMPRPPGGAPIPDLITALWIATMAYAVFQGLMYGTRTAIIMDITNPRVAATQFTAYMAMMNLAISISASWQGVAAEAWGYPMTLLADAIVGVACLALLPVIKPERTFTDSKAEGRARKSSLVLGLACLAWLPYWADHAIFGRAQPIMGTFFTLVFISSALFLLAGREVLGAAAGAWRKAALWVAPFLLAMYGRYSLDRLATMPALRSLAEVLLYLVPLAGGIVLLGLASRHWAPAQPEALSDAAGSEARA